MGSSAAVAIAAIRAVLIILNRSLAERPWKCWSIRRRPLPTVSPAVLDAKTCLVTKLSALRETLVSREIEVNLGAYLVIADTGIHGNTREAVERG